MYENIVNYLIAKNGGYRERDILENDPVIEKGHTWNEQHKVLTVTATKDDKKSFEIDIKSGLIVG